MSWAMHVKIQNLGLVDTCSPSGKKMIPDPRANWIKEGAGGTTEEAHQERFFFFSGWLSMAFFTCLCTIQLVFLASQSVVDQQPICTSLKYTYQVGSLYIMLCQKEQLISKNKPERHIFIYIINNSELLLKIKMSMLLLHWSLKSSQAFVRNHQDFPCL